MADTVRLSSISAVTDLERMGIGVGMLTGDNAQTARAIAAQLGISEVISEFMPGEKADQIRRLQKDGKPRGIRRGWYQ